MSDKEVREFVSPNGQKYLFKLVRIIGIGNSSEIYTVTEQSLAKRTTGNDEIFILKCISMETQLDLRNQAQYEKLMKLQHSNIVKYFAYGEDTGGFSYGRIRIYAVQEYLAGGTLTSHCSTVELEESDIRLFTSHIVNGLVYLHALKPSIIHADLKGDNVILTVDKRTAKICDLDSSLHMKTTVTRGSDVPGKVGTVCFMSPEMLRCGMDGAEPVGRLTDIWSVACIVLQMYGRGEFYFTEKYGQICSVKNHSEEFIVVIMKGGRPHIPASASYLLRLFVRECLEHTPGLRPPASDLLKNDFLLQRTDDPPHPPEVKPSQTGNVLNIRYDSRLPEKDIFDKMLAPTENLLLPTSIQSSEDEYQRLESDTIDSSATETPEVSKISSEKCIKCVIVGDKGVGKTSMLMTYVTDKFPDPRVSNVFDNCEVKLSENNKTVTLGLWDTEGEKDKDRFRPLAYPNTDVFLICFDVTTPASFESVVEKWKPEIQNYAGNSSVIVVGTKVDIRDDRDKFKLLGQVKHEYITKEEGKQLAARIQAKCYLECSSRTQAGLNDVFREAARVGLLLGPREPKKYFCVVN